MCEVCGEDLCHDPSRRSKSALSLHGSLWLNVSNPELGLSGIGPDGKIKGLATIAGNPVLDALQNAGWEPPFPRKSPSDAKIAIAYHQVTNDQFWNDVCGGPHRTTASVATLTDGNTVWLTVNGSTVGKPVVIDDAFMAKYGWKRRKDGGHSHGSKEWSSGAIVGAAVGGSLVVLGIVVLVTLMIRRSCKK